MLLDLRSLFESRNVAADVVTVTDASFLEFGVPIVVTDDSTVRIHLNVAIGDDVTITESTVVFMTVGFAVSDDVSTTESVTASIPSFATLAPSVFDALTAAEASTLLLLMLVPAVSESVSLTELATLTMLLSATVTDDVTVTEANALLIIGGTLAMTVEDDVTITEQRSLVFDPASAAVTHVRRFQLMGVGA
jgi:hypothetical protein